MLSHESLMSYYTDNNKLLFKLKGEFDQNMTLTELEEMIPYERTTYFILMNQSIKEREQEKNNK